jgi:hypothetical protein
VESDWIDRTIAIGDKIRLLISGPWPRRVMTTLLQATCQRVPPSWVPRRNTIKRMWESMPT